MEAEIRVRRVRASDGAVVKRVRLSALKADPSSFEATYAHEAAFAEGEWDGWAAGDASGDEMTTLLALRDRKPVGIVAAYRDETQPWLFHVVAMWVAPEVRRTGLGRRLLREIEKWIADCGGTRVQLSVADTALAASRLYETSGYEPDGERTESPHTPGVVHLSLHKGLQGT
jgi:ribosomal protein S18 acetylase RimI-like enzyme